MRIRRFVLCSWQHVFIEECGVFHVRFVFDRFESCLVLAHVQNPHDGVWAALSGAKLDDMELFLKYACADVMDWPERHGLLAVSTEDLPDWARAGVSLAEMEFLAPVEEEVVVQAAA